MVVFVRDIMTPSPITIDHSTPVLEAIDIMKRHRIRQLPVTRQGQLVGLVTERELLTVSPSPATTLSIFELNYLLSKMKVSEAMVKNPVTVSPDTTVEQAALIMRDQKIGSLLVTEKGQLVGIITQTDIFEALLRFFGLRRPGTRIVIETGDRIGLLAEILQVVKEHRIDVIGIACLNKDDHRVQIVLRLSTAEPAPLIADLNQRGYPVVHVS